MINLFLGESYKGKPTGHLKKYEVENFEALCKNILSQCVKGAKNEYYFTIASEIAITPGDPSQHPQSYKAQDHYHRSNATQQKAWLCCLDGDASKSNPKSSIPPKEVHEIYKKYGINHCVYTTYSHSPLSNRWRLVVPCSMPDIAYHKPTVDKLTAFLNGTDYKPVTESKTWSSPWFTPSRENPEDGLFECYYYTDGVDFAPAPPEEKSSPVRGDGTTPTTEEQKTLEELIFNIATATSPLHDSILRYSNFMVKEGASPKAVTSTLHALTVQWDMTDEKLKGYKKDFARLVLGAVKGLEEVNPWNEEIKKYVPKGKADPNRTFTKYPDQTGMFEKLVQWNMAAMHYPNRPIAVAAARFQISVLGGRVYSDSNGKGLVQTMLLVGRSTIGKDSIKTNFIRLLNGIGLEKLADAFLGAGYYTSVKNFVEDLNGRPSVASIRSESGQLDRSKAGDISRLTAYELNAAVQSGFMGRLARGAQNEQVPPIYQPSVTTLKESVAEIQNETDLINQTSIQGTEGRRSYIVADPFKPYKQKPISYIPADIKQLIKNLVSLAMQEVRLDWTKPIPRDNWIYWQFEDYSYFEQKCKEWTDLDNKNYEEGNHYASTIYGRLGERVPGYAALLAVCEDQANPIITNKQIDIAEASFIAEIDTHTKQSVDGDFDGPWAALERKVVEIFSGDMQRHIKYYQPALRKVAEKELSKGYLEWSALRRMLSYADAFKMLSKDSYFHQKFEKHSESWNIRLCGNEEVNNIFGHSRRTFKRV